MRRRAFLCGSGAMLATSLVRGVCAAGQRQRIGLLNTAKPGRPEAAFRQGLQALGYVEGDNLVVDSRGADGRAERLPTLVHELLVARPDVIVTFGALAAQAAKDATTMTPIVMAFAGGPLGTRLVGQEAMSQG
jgi:putative ABC transport system substrate-binding protein